MKVHKITIKNVGDVSGEIYVTDGPEDTITIELLCEMEYTIEIPDNEVLTVHVSADIEKNS